jgi:hypothetical protein
MVVRWRERPGLCIGVHKDTPRFRVLCIGVHKDTPRFRVVSAVGA